MSSIAFMDMEDAFKELSDATLGLHNAEEQLGYSDHPMDIDAGYDGINAAKERKTQAEIRLIIAARKVDFSSITLPMAYFVQGEAIGIDLTKDA